MIFNACSIDQAFRRFPILSMLAWLAVFCGGEIQAQPSGWPQFLGPNRNGISSETKLLTQWPVGGVKQVWRVPGGVGMSGLAIDRGRLVTLLQKNGKQSVAAFDAKTGKPAWETAVANEYKNSMGDGPRATPTISGKSVFVFTGEGILAALEFEDGTIQWKKDLVKDLNGKPADYGMACSPLVVDENVVVTVGAPRATVVAINASSGETAWRAGSDSTGYSSPALLHVGGRKQIVACTGDSVLGLDPGSGAQLWRYPFVTDYGCNTATPVAIDGNVLVSAGESHGSVLLQLTPNGDAFDVTERWTSLGRDSVLRSEWQTPILLNGFLYGMDNVGSAGPVTHLTCIEAATGKQLWRQTRFGKGNLIAADGKLFLSTMKGELVVAAASPEGYREIGRMTVVGKNRQAPALAGGLLYLRDDSRIVCLDVRQPE